MILSDLKNICNYSDKQMSQPKAQLMYVDMISSSDEEYERKVKQHYDTLQSVGAHTNSNLILLPNSPQAGADMLNQTIASFTASNQVGEAIKSANAKKEKLAAKPKPSDEA